MADIWQKYAATAIASYAKSLLSIVFPEDGDNEQTVIIERPSEPVTTDP